MILLRLILRQIHWQLALRELLALHKIMISPLLSLWLSEVKLVLLLWSHIQNVVIFTCCNFDRACSSSWNSQKFGTILKNALMLLWWTSNSCCLIVNLSICCSSHLHIICIPFLIVTNQSWSVHCGPISHLSQSCVQISIVVKERSVRAAAGRILRNCRFCKIDRHLLNSSWFVRIGSSQVLCVTAGLLRAYKIWTSTLCTAIIWIVDCRSLQAWIEPTNQKWRWMTGSLGRQKLLFWRQWTSLKYRNLLFKFINLLIQTIQIGLVVCHFHISQILRISLRMANFLLFELYFCFKDHKTWFLSIVF